MSFDFKKISLSRAEETNFDFTLSLADLKNEDGKFLSVWEKFQENVCRTIMDEPNLLKLHLMIDHIMIYH